VRGPDSVQTRFRVNVMGAEDVVRELKALGKPGKARLRKVLEDGADRILERARPLTPREKGWLEKSLRKTRVMIGKARTTISVLAGGFFGGADRETGAYAVVQHDDLTIHHTTPGTGPKFLERPVLAAWPEIYEELQDALEEETHAARG
jgi:hypothetical protein